MKNIWLKSLFNKHDLNWMTIARSWMRIKHEKLCRGYQMVSDAQREFVGATTEQFH